MLRRRCFHDTNPDTRLPLIVSGGDIIGKFRDTTRRPSRLAIDQIVSQRMSLLLLSVHKQSCPRSSTVTKSKTP